ncbi:CAMK protein kinase [Ilyonectria robusta]
MDGFSASQRVPPSPSPKTTKVVKARYISDLVLDSKLDTEISNAYTQHVRYIPGHAASERRVRVVERWVRENPLGRGSYGTVYRERCEEDESKLRAVKEIGKYTMEWEKLDYTRELEAIFKFSHPKASQIILDFRPSS